METPSTKIDLETALCLSQNIGDADVRNLVQRIIRFDSCGISLELCERDLAKLLHNKGVDDPWQEAKSVVRAIQGQSL